MKATQQQYEEAVKLYEEGGVTDVYAYAEKLGIDEWSECVHCDAVTPDCHDGACFVCGSPKRKTYQVTVKAVITKTFDIHSDSADAAAREAYELFNPYSGECEEKYEQEVVKIERK